MDESLDVLPDIATLIDDACLGATSLRDVVNNARGAVGSAGYADRDRRLERLAPTHVEVPTGSRIRLDWSNASPEAGPVLAVRLQELFGLAETPRVGPAPGVAVTLHLLAPNMRPQQVTSDLASFWKQTYPQVRKDLRARYPKHDWPEDPLSAPPRRGARRRGVPR